MHQLAIITTAMPELGLTQTQGRFTVASRLSFSDCLQLFLFLPRFALKLNPFEYFDSQLSWVPIYVHSTPLPMTSLPHITREQWNGGNVI